ncbi:unnamed protein product [Bubo scandiacus]
MEEPQLPADINPNNFPAKLWRLVNSPRVQSICWDARGEGLIIDQPLFEREVLGTGPGSDGASGAAGLFKTKSFASLTRQFNLYGFRKLGETSSAAGGGSDGGGGSPGPLHRFYSPHFLRDHPNLLVRMKRLTKANKAKLAAGLEVKSRPPTASQRLLGTAMDQDLLLPPSALGEAHGPGLLAVEQLHQPYHQAYCPTATPRLCSPPAHTDPLTGCASPTASTYTHCSFLQVSRDAEIRTFVLYRSPWYLPPPAGLQCKAVEGHFAGPFRLLDPAVACSIPLAKSIENCWTHPEDSEPYQHAGRRHMMISPVSVGSRRCFVLSAGRTGTVGQERLNLVLALTQSCGEHPLKFLLPSLCVYAEEGVVVQVLDKRRCQPKGFPMALFPVLMQHLQTTPSKSLVNCEPDTSETEGRQFASGTEPVNKSVEETDSSVTPRCRKRDLSSHEGKSSDLHVLADTAFEQEFFQKEETGE